MSTSWIWLRFPWFVSHKSLYGNFLKLGSQWGRNKSTTSHYLHFVQHQFWSYFLIINFVFIHYHNKIIFESSFNIYHVLVLCFCIFKFGLNLGLHLLWFIFLTMPWFNYYSYSYSCLWNLHYFRYSTFNNNMIIINFIIKIKLFNTFFWRCIMGKYRSGEMKKKTCLIYESLNEYLIPPGSFLTLRV